MQFKREKNNKIELNINNTKKFNEFSIEVVFRGNDISDYAERYLISKALVNSLYLFKTRIDVKKYYMSLNDVLVNSGVRISHKGKHELYVTFSFLNPDVIKNQKDYRNKIIECLNNVLFYNRKEKNSFDEYILNTEKQVILNELKNRKDDKQLYVIDRINKIMFEETIFEKPPYGNLEDYNKINLKTLYKHYISCLENDDIIINIVGYDDDIIENIKKLFGINIKNHDIDLSNKKIKNKNILKTNNSIGNFKKIIEKQNINQSKIALGYRVDTDICNNNYFQYKIANEIFGGSAHSNLFQNIRENNSLCYYIYSFLSEHKGCVYILSGIENKQIGKTIKLIKKELKTLQEGNFTDEQIFMAKESIISSLFYKQDHPKSIINFMHLWNMYKSIDEIKKNFEKVKKEEIISAFNNFKEDTIFILEGVNNVKTT